MLLALLGKVNAQQKHSRTCDAHYDSMLRAHHLRGGYLIYNEQKDELATNHFDLLDTMLSPASTFKIYNALQALDNNVLRDENDTLHWDGRKRMVDAWNRDLTLQEAFNLSAVWYFQEVARRTGKERMEAALKKLDYGNKSAAGAVDSFWLNGPLRITARQQLNLLRRLYHKQLPFGLESQQRVKRIMKNAEPGLYGKTGWGMWQGKDLGWFIGWMEHDGKPVFFVHILIADELPDDEFGRLRRSMILENIRCCLGKIESEK